MFFPKTVVINSAGIGSRLGFGKTKSLIEINGKTIIARHLEMLENISDVRVVVGFQAEQVIEAVLTIRKNVTFVFNHNYHSTGTAHSFYLGSRYANPWIISLDGDLLIDPHDFHQFLMQNKTCLGYCKPMTEEPVFVDIANINNETFITNFSQQSGQYEWTGLFQIASKDIGVFTKTHVFQSLQEKLPLAGMLVRAQDIDTQADLDRARSWIDEIIMEN